MTDVSVREYRDIFFVPMAATPRCLTETVAVL